MVVNGGQETTLFASISATDSAALGNAESVSVTLSQPQYSYPTVSDFGRLVDPNGGGTFNGSTFAEAGLHTGTPIFATTLLNRLVYVAPALSSGQTAVVLATVAVSDGEGNLAVDAPLVINVVTAPLIAGTVANQPVNAGDKISPFATANITDTDFSGYYYLNGQYVSQGNSTDTATITIRDGGTPTDEDGLLTGPGLSKTGVGVYTLTALNYSIGYQLQALKFATTVLAAGQTKTVKFELDITDNKAGLTARDTVTSVLNIGPAVTPVPPTISGTRAGQTVSPGNVVNPFSSVTVGDANANPSVRTTITVSNGDANGRLTGTGLTEVKPGVYVLATTTAAAMTNELQALTFHPADLPPGAIAETTTFTLEVTDPTANKSALPDQTTSVIETSAAGLHSRYIIWDDNGSCGAVNIATGVVQKLPAGQVSFQDGIGVFDPTGNAENVSRLYLAAFGRAPDVAGLRAWANVIDSSFVPLSVVATSFAASPEFIGDYGTLSNAGFVDRLYQNVLGRPGDTGGTQAWTGALSAGTSRGSVLLGFAESAENRANTISMAGDVNDAEAYRLYQAALDRAPDTAGLSGWSAMLAAGTSPTQIAQGFLNSAEFQQKHGVALTAGDFVSTLYQNVLHRPADQAGLQAWTAALQQGISQATVLVGFSDSSENRLQTADATHANWVFIPT